MLQRTYSKTVKMETDKFLPPKFSAAVKDLIDFVVDSKQDKPEPQVTTVPEFASQKLKTKQQDMLSPLTESNISIKHKRSIKSGTHSRHPTSSSKFKNQERI